MARKIEEILRQYGVPFKRSGEHRHVRGGFIGVDCFQCGPNSGKFHAGISPNGRVAVCWRCGKLRLDALLVSLTKQPISTVRSWLANISGPLPEQTARTGRLQIPPGIGDLQKQHRRYLASRYLDPDEMVVKWGLKGIGLSLELPWRIFIPIDYHGKTVSWTTRAIADAELRYISASAEEEEINHKHLLFGADYAGHTIVVFEGPFSVFRVGYGAVATLGVGYSNEQLLAMSKFPTRIICFDAETKAQQRAMRLCNDLGAFPGVTKRIEMESAKTADDASEEEILEIRKFFD